MYIGIDLGQLKVKWASLDGDGRLTWGGRPVGSAPGRRKEVKDALHALASQLNFAAARAIVVSTSNAYAFGSFEEALAFNHECFAAAAPDAAVYFVSDHGELMTLDALRVLPRDRAATFAGTNFWGSLYLGSTLVSDGLVIDMGTTSTEVTPVIGGVIDPAGRASAAPYGIYRHQSRQLTWYGVTVTPIEYVMQQFEQHPVLPRCFRVVHAAALLEKLPVELARAHAASGAFPSHEESHAALAQALGLDTVYLPRAAAIRFAEAVWDALVEQVADVIRSIGTRHLSAFPHVDVAVSGIGLEAVLLPALRRAGVSADRVRTHPLVADLEHRAMSSAIGCALYGKDQRAGA